MAEGKASLKRSKPSYVYSIIGVALVLFLMGIMGWFILNFKAGSIALKEQIELQVYLKTTSTNKDSISRIQQYIALQPYAKDVRYIDKEAAKKIWNKDNSEDWAKTMTENPLPESINFYAKAEYVNKDSLQKISSQITSLFGSQVDEIRYASSLVNFFNQNSANISLIFLIIATILIIIIIVSIDNTIKLTMFSNRFLIKTMQMVGATRGFIAKPMNTRAIINGLISSACAIGLLIGLIQLFEYLFPPLADIKNTTQMSLVLFGIIIFLGVGISVFSTNRSVRKYLKMKLDDLY